MIMTESQRRLAADNHGMIYKVLNDLELPDEDYYGIAAIGLCKAAMAYQPGTYKFSTCAYKCIYNEVKTAQRLAHYPKRRYDGQWVSYNELSPEGTELIETFESGADPEKDAIISVLAQQLVKCLRPREIEIARMLASGMGRREVAALLGISRQRIGQILDRARHRVVRRLRLEE